MAYCSNCGAEVARSSSFCDSCGEEIQSVPDTETRRAGTSGSVTVETQLKVILGSAGLAIVGSILPWYSFLGTTVLGIEGDGIITLIVGVIAGVGGWWLDSQKRALGLGAVCGLIVTLVALSHVRSISAIGVYVTLAGGLGMLGAGAYGYWQLR